MKKTLGIILFSTMFALVGCGNSGKKLVSDVGVQTVDENQNKYVITDFRLDIGNLELPEWVLPLPSDYGNFRSYRKNDGNYLALDLNVTSILNLPGSIATLPNGQVVPMNVGGSGIIELPISQINGKAYLAVAEGVAMVGVAVVIKQLDDLDVGRAGVFPTFKLGKVDVMAGVFTSDADQSSGIAIFANVAGFWNGDTKAYDRSELVFEPEYVKKSKKRRIYRKLRRLLKKKMQVDFVKF